MRGNPPSTSPVRWTVAALGLAGTLLLGACGGDAASGQQVASLDGATDGSSTDDATSTTVDIQDALLAYAACMRDNGVQMDDPTFLLSDLTALDGHRFVALERDNTMGATTVHKQGFVIDLRRTDASGALVKQQVLDLEHLRDPALISLPARPGDIGLGDPFAMPYVTIEAILPRRDSDPGRVMARRLNRVEYDNTIRDLLGVHPRASLEFPVDDSGYGFDNIGDVLSISAALFELYLSAARKISHLAVGRAPGTAAIETYTIPKLLDQKDRMSEKLPFGSTGGAAISHTFPVDGDYLLKTENNPIGASAATFTLPAWVPRSEVRVTVSLPAGVAASSTALICVGET